MYTVSELEVTNFKLLEMIEKQNLTLHACIFKNTKKNHLHIKKIARDPLRSEFFFQVQN